MAPFQAGFSIEKEEKPSSSSSSPHGSSGMKATSASQSAAPTKSSASKARPMFGLMHYLIHAVLFVLCLALAATYTLKIIHDDYFVTLIERARRTDEDLVDEYTYYERRCNVVDITATKEEANQLIVDSKETAIPTMMTHGAIMIPQVLSDSMIQELRDFVVWKNHAVSGTDDEYPVTAGEHRISYGIEAAEHPTVVRALKAVHDNGQLKGILEGLVGRNPALTEITAITSRYGSSHQPWHPDVKPDGNGVQFGRTYSHSYSLFIPLQNTTGAMGATDLCPGTHYCADWIDAQCEENKIGLHEIRDGGIWKAGDAVLLNQQVWHRGTEHTDPDAQERILFILSFIGRPTDNRQLARGTYFHMKWNMWGHTWQDLADAAISMASPWNMLRCLHLWKAKGREWGYDLFTAATLRIANQQLGCEPGDLEGLLNVLAKHGFPGWLDGTIDLEHEEAWQIYLGETVELTLAFLIKANAVAIALYLVMCLGPSLTGRSGSRSPTRSFSGNLLLLFRTYGIAIALGWFALNKVQSSPWARNISAGKTLMRPFPVAKDVMRDDPSVVKGPTTVPLRTDVLVGTRLASKTIGVYSRWHDFHPGNRKFMKDVSAFGGKFFRSLETSFPILADTVVQGAMQDIQYDNGRFLQQDYRTGDWRLMSEAESLEYIRMKLFFGTNTVEAAIKGEIDYLLGDYRFGFARLMAMSKISQTRLQALEKLLTRTHHNEEFSTSRRRLASFSSVTEKSKSQLKIDVASVVTPSCERVLEDDRASTNLFKDFNKELPELRPYSEVNWHYTEDSEDEVGELIPATILSLYDDEYAEIALYGEWAYEFDSEPVIEVPIRELSPRIQPVEGLPVRGNYLRLGDWWGGKIQNVRPSGRITILYEDGDSENETELDQYIVQ
ncbi:unnamed protein product [Cylindrotheca closterium]|uniref:Uncharacterized protein n=1 Tax=Cylindrotheca closterium TaxID=2856 RepID=A0AAD2CBT9_9STRA|nr:unnamed protein product [Cylindrotheca closterium]